MRINLATLMLACFAVPCWSQEAPSETVGTRAMTIAHRLEQLYKLPSGTVWILFPPQKDFQAGQVISIDDNRVPAQVDLLPPETFNLNPQTSRVSLAESRAATHEVLHSLLALEKPLESTANVLFTCYVDGFDYYTINPKSAPNRLFREAPANEIPDLDVQIKPRGTRDFQSPETTDVGQQQPRDLISNYLVNSRPSVVSVVREIKPMLVTGIFRGNLVYEIRFENDIPEKVESASKDWELLDWRPEPSVVKLISKQPLTFAYQVQSLGLVASPTLATEYIDVTRIVASVDPDRTPSWVAAEPLEVKAPVDLGYRVVKVPYATDRVPNPDWAFYFKGFFTDAFVAILFVVCCLGVIGGILLIISRAFKPAAIVSLLSVLGIASLIGIGYVGASRRIEENEKKGFVVYGGDSDTTLHYGTVQVTIPNERNTGELKTPFTFLTVTMPENAQRHFTVKDVSELPAQPFFDQLRDSISQSKAKDAFIFVHGYNTTFEFAALRTAQLCKDIPFEGAPILYSWPSLGEEIPYTRDEQNAALSSPRFQQFLIDVSKKSNAKKIHIIAHSMGNRVVLNALKSIHEQKIFEKATSNLSNLVMAAPDVDTREFDQSYRTPAVGTMNKVALYAYDRDSALGKSIKVHGYSRFGVGGNSLFVSKDLESIDSSSVQPNDTHSYIFQLDPLLGDVYQFIVDMKPAADRRRLMKQSRDELDYWLLKP